MVREVEAMEMTRKTVVFYLLLSFLPLVVIPNLSFADSAEVLPKGRSRVSINPKFFFPITERYNPKGDVEDISVDFNTSLNSNVFPGLRQLESLLGLPRGFASLGDSVVSFKYHVTELNFAYQYGITDRLTAGIFIPYWWLKNRVRARLDTTRATVGKSPRLGSLVPLGATPDTVPLTTEDVQQILGNGLDINGDGRVDVPGFAFRRFETWSGNGLADLEAGFRYQYFKTDNWRLALGGGARFPTGEVDDPDHLVDLSFGDGAYAMLFRVHNDFTGVKHLVLNFTFRYDLVLPDTEVRRVPENVNQPITTNRARVDRDLGDIFEFETSGAYELFKGIGLSALYKFGFKLKDDVSGKQRLAFESLEDETNYTEHIFVTSVSYTTLPLYLEKKFPVPLTASLAYRNRFAGTNNAFKSQYLSFTLAVFF